MAPMWDAPRRRIRTQWSLARLDGPAHRPAGDSWMPASVPGAVQLDWARARGLPDYKVGRNVRLYAGLEDSFWLYRTAVPKAELRDGERMFVVFDGVDFECELRVAGEPVLKHRGVQAAFDFDVSGLAPGTPLEILIHPAPKRHRFPENPSQASHVTKAPVSYGWDWHPRLIPLGICGQTAFEIRPAAYLTHVDFQVALADDFSSADILVSIGSHPPGRASSWRLLDPGGAPVLECDGPAAVLPHPKLWWTHDHGEASLYTLEAGMRSGERIRRKVGFRRVRLAMFPGAWEEEPGYPKSRNPPPVAVELNGRRIFIKGSNWVPPDIFRGRECGEGYRPLLRLARGAHFNMLRCWGGGAAPKEAFFEQCDELGLLVWQEFPLACNCYPDDPAYLRMLDEESRALIRRLRGHPCLGLWCGGNELFNAWSRMTDQSLPIRLLNRNCYEMDPLTPFLPTAPVQGMGHGDYRFLAGGRDIFGIFQSARCTAYSEFGCPGASPVDYLRTFIPEDELWPPRTGTSWETHHGLGAWEAEPTSWLCTAALETLFGPLRSLEDAVQKSAWLQSEGCKSVFEEARRQQPRCGIALSWCFNEPWPTAANNSLINWPAQPKPAYEAVRDACRPVLASARLPRFQWRGGERFSAELWLLNDQAADHGGGEVRASIVMGARRWQIGSWSFESLPAQQTLRGPRVEFVLPDDGSAEFVVELAVHPQSAWSSRYRLSLRP